MDHSTTDQVHAVATSPDDWKYISEGGATIVFSYRGPPHPVFSGTVLRLRKASRQLIREDNGQIKPESASSGEEEEEPDDASISFQHRVTSQLIEPAYLPRLEPIRVDRAWLEALRDTSEGARPAERQHRDEIDVSRRKAVLATDLVGGDGWAVEIKPKWGFLPNQTHLSDETRIAKSRRCRFCMHSQYRGEKGESASHEYCPLDLYSGDKERVSHALRCLWRAWVRSGGAVNNLKFFARGELVDPRISSEELEEVLLGPSKEVAEDNFMEAFVAAVLPLLMETPVLQRLAHLQRTLDSLDIEGLYALHTAYAQTRFPERPSSANSLEDLFPDPSLDEWVRFIATYQSQEQETPRKFDPALLQYHAIAYLLSATFKDCSIILHLGRRPDVPDNITVIDLDPKSMKRLKKWAELDHDIAMSFVDDGVKICHDCLSQTVRDSC